MASLMTFLARGLSTGVSSERRKEQTPECGRRLWWAARVQTESSGQWPQAVCNALASSHTTLMSLRGACYSTLIFIDRKTQLRDEHTCPRSSWEEARPGIQAEADPVHYV